MNTDPRITAIFMQLASPESVQAVRTTLDKAEELYKELNLRQDVIGLIERAFGCLRELTATDPGTATTVLLHDLLPRCLRLDDEGEGQQSPRYNFVFGEWLGTLPEDHRIRVRDVALPRALTALDGPGINKALNLIAAIGYWDKDLLDRLDRLINTREDEIGDRALSVRAWLTPSPEVFPWLLHELHCRITQGPTLRRLIASTAIASPESAVLFWYHWLKPALPLEAKTEVNSLFFSTLDLFAQIAARYRDGALPGQVWTWAMHLLGAIPAKMENYLAINGGFVPSINVSAVIPDIIRQAGNSSGFNCYRYYLRLRECAQPAHMAGWDALSPPDLNKVKEDATKPTGMIGNSSTVEFDQKEASLDLLLCRGDRAHLPSFDGVLAGETSGYSCQRFLDLAGCLALDPLPSEVHHLLAGSVGREGWSEQERLVAQVGAIRAAHGAANQEAFEVLLGYRQVGPGVLVSAMEALAETVSLNLTTESREPVEKLFAAAEGAPSQDTRGAAAGAIAILLENGQLIDEEIDRAAALTVAPKTDLYARRELLFAFAAQPPDQVPSSLLEFAKGLLDQSPVNDNLDPRSAVLALLGQQPASRSDETFLTQRLGLVLHEGGVQAATPAAFQGTIPYVVGRYFLDEPERFGLAVASLLSEGNAAALAHLLPFVQKISENNPGIIIDALLARLRRTEDGRVAELSLIHTLATVAPDRFLKEGCLRTDSWLPHARAELANTLGRLASLPENLNDLRFNLLMRLTGDGIYAVRRAAYRAAAMCDGDKFVKIVRGWAKWRGQTPGEGPRRRAAECLQWLPPEVVKDLRELAWDQEPGVREVYRKAMAERDECERAREYEKVVLSVRDSDQVIKAWKYGIALSQLGGDSTLECLMDRLRDHLHPAVRFWLLRVRNAVERRWSEVTQKWPDPWFARPGHLETFIGTIRNVRGDFAVRGILWRMEAELPSGWSSWGGWATSEETGVESGELLIPGRCPGQVLITAVSIFSDKLGFTGTGPYPDPLS